ncbi:MAG: MFS transporter [Candidatus Protistobacter heckmanni]|nr:MFS transporter [Candidatus Protistobacter heckmanni]
MSTAVLAWPGVRSDAQIIGLVAIAHATSHFFHLILAPLFPWIKPAFGLSYVELGLLMTVFFVVSCVVQALSGFLMERVGARPVLFAGLGLLAASAGWLSLAQSYEVLIAGTVIAGLGNGIFHLVDYTLLNHRERAPVSAMPSPCTASRARWAGRPRRSSSWASPNWPAGVWRWRCSR